MEPNPFTPVFGKVPPYMAGRQPLIDAVVDAFEHGGTGNPNLSSIFVGPRGTGKTALLSYLGFEASSRGWVVANVTAIGGMLDNVLQQATAQASHLIDASGKKRLSSIEVAGVGGIAWEASASAVLTWRSRMDDLLDQLAEQGVGLLITVDEVNPHLDEMVELATTYQHFIREDRKVSLLMAGLPHRISTLLSGESTSFLRRAFRHDLGSISDSEVAEALRITFEDGGRTIEGEALAEAVRAVNGFPFMLQLVGYRAWAMAEESAAIGTSDVRAAARIAQDDLRRQVFESTYNELSDGDVAFLAAMLQDEGPSDPATLGKRLGKPSGHVSTYKRRLLESGVIEEALRGKVRFSLPGFREYLAEVEDA